MAYFLVNLVGGVQVKRVILGFSVLSGAGVGLSVGWWRCGEDGGEDAVMWGWGATRLLLGMNVLGDAVIAVSPVCARTE
jgi:hypothetical protein